MKFIKFFALILIALAIVPLIYINAKEGQFYWYAKRNSEHKQPICEPNLAFVEQNGGIYVDRNYGDDNEEKVIYLTFDAGYENGNVAKILDVLKDEDVKGSFFILGHVINSFPELTLRMANEGHLVCNHTVNHRNLVGADIEKFEDEILTLEKMYENLTGKRMAKFFRPPEGVFNEEMLKRAQNLGFRTVFWSFAYADWDNNNQMAEDVAMEKIMDNLHNGEIMLLHPTSATNAKIMKKLIQTLKEQGYRFDTLDNIKT